MKIAKSAGKLVVLENSDRISAETERIQDRIRERAYELSQMRGHSGRETDDWLSAESEIISVPPVEVIERDGTYEVQCAIAGINPDDVNVMAAPDQLLVQCDFRHDHDSESGIVHVCDFKSATVFRFIRFPQPIDLKNLKVQFQDGVLRITARKVGREQAPAKRSPVRKTAAKKGKKTTRGAA